MPACRWRRGLKPAKVTGTRSTRLHRPDTAWDVGPLGWKCPHVAMLHKSPRVSGADRVWCGWSVGGVLGVVAVLGVD